MPKSRSAHALLTLAILVQCLLLPRASSADSFIESFKEIWREGHWRLETSGFAGLNQGRHGREGDFNLNVTVERELPLFAHLTVGPKFHPVFIYDESSSSGDDTIFAAGLGPSIRLYAKREPRGLFVEGSVTFMLQTEKFEENSTIFNFLSQFGIGYKFGDHWHVSAQWRHLSNAGLGDENAGVNGVGLGFGYTF